MNNEIELTQYCQHSGRPCGKIDMQSYLECVTLHGEREANIILSHMRKSVSMDWVWQNGKGLDELMKWKGKEYFIFSMGQILNVPFETKITMWQELHNDNWNSELAVIVANCNELAKRILSKVSPDVIKPWAKRFDSRILQIINNPEFLGELQIALQELLTKLIEKEGELISANINGFANFKEQKQLKPLTDWEREFARELNDFGNLDEFAEPEKPMIQSLAKQLAKQKVDKLKNAVVKFGLPKPQKTKPGIVAKQVTGFRFGVKPNEAN